MSVAGVLVIDSDELRRQQIKAVLEFIDCEAIYWGDGSQCAALMETANQPQALLLGRCSSWDEVAILCRTVKAKAPQLPIVLLGSTEERDALPDDVQAALFCCIDWPIKYRQLTSALQQCQPTGESRDEADALKRSPELFRSLVGNSRSIARVRTLIQQVANSGANVLILGESGTGKEVVARNVHYHSSRRHKAFVPINCGAIPSDLLESELFGHEKGAFTGAISARQGRFELAEGGTLFLDEIGDMSLHMQVKLLRVLQERTFERVGSNKTITADVRIVAATHRNLEEAISNGKFREDLFYRLNVFPIEMPPLRERLDDIPLLINELITRLEHEKRGSTRLTAAAVIALTQYHWPGNVRELANLIERLVIIYPFGVVDAQDLPEKFRANMGNGNFVPPPLAIESLVMISAEGGGFPRLPKEGLDLKEHLNTLEYSLIKQALDDADGVVAHAAQRLRLRRTTLVEKLRKYGLQRGDEMAEL